MVARMQMALHEFDVVRVRSGLKFIGNKIVLVIFVIHGKCLELLSPFGHFSGTDGTDKARIQTAGEKRSDGDVRNHLACNGITDKKPNFFHCFFERFPVFPVRQMPVLAKFQFAVLKAAAPARFQLVNIPEYTAARNPSRPKQQYLGSALGIQLCFHTGVSEKGFDITTHIYPL